jgi:hypothetical protein
MSESREAAMMKARLARAEHVAVECLRLDGHQMRSIGALRRRD